MSRSALSSIVTALALVCLAVPPVFAAELPAGITARVEAHATAFGDVSRQIWEWAEPGFQEAKSSALLADQLRRAGFTVRDHLAGMPTAFVAEWGSGSPVVGIMGEFDALPGLSQETVPSPQARAGGTYGHGCGHNLLGAGSALAAVAVKEWLEAGHHAGTVRFFGTPAEEGGDGKVYMARAGLFDGVDIVLHWHPGDRNIATIQSTLAMIGAKFQFHGQAAHAAAAPDKGRSALDAALLMTHAVDMLREHIPQESRVHYIFTRAGDAPNIVPAEAEVYLYARHPRMAVLDGIWDWILDTAKAGALGTQTTTTVQIVGSSYDTLPNGPLSSLIDRHLREVGGVRYAPEEQAFAETLRKTLPLEGALELGSQEGVRPPDEAFTSGSTDAGDISWMVPTGWFFAATHVPGVPNHSWQATACTGGTIGRKAMLIAAKTLALSAADLFTDPALVRAAREDFDRRRAGKTYHSRIPADMAPPLTYRNK